MSLVQDAMCTWVKLVEVSQPDGYGGRTATYAAGEPFEAALRFDNSIEALRAQAAGVKSVYTVMTGRETVLKYHDIIRRLDDGKILRITSNGDDKKTPRIAGLDLQSVTAEEWHEQSTGNS